LSPTSKRKIISAILIREHQQQIQGPRIKKGGKGLQDPIAKLKGVGRLEYTRKSVPKTKKSGTRKSQQEKTMSGSQTTTTTTNKWRIQSRQKQRNLLYKSERDGTANKEPFQSLKNCAANNELQQSSKQKKEELCS
jgi:hypothetical protein